MGPGPCPEKAETLLQMLSPSSPCPRVSRDQPPAPENQARCPQASPTSRAETDLFSGGKRFQNKLLTFKNNCPPLRTIKKCSASRCSPVAGRADLGAPVPAAQWVPPREQEDAPFPAFIFLPREASFKVETCPNTTPFLGGGSIRKGTAVFLHP